MSKGIGDRFFDETKYRREELKGGYLDWNLKPDSDKKYLNVPQVALPHPDKSGGIPIWEVVGRRRSVRRFSKEPIQLKDVSQLLWASQGITFERGGFSFRAAPSAGALYPIETYVAAHAVKGLEPGIYHFRIQTSGLEKIKGGDFRKKTAAAALDQEFVSTAPCVFLWTAVFERSKWKYKQRAYRYVFLDCGHLAQNLALAAVAQGLGSCFAAALYDEEANSLVGVDGENESSLLMCAVGRPR